jgi:hypothetical protein
MLLEMVTELAVGLPDELLPLALMQRLFCEEKAPDHEYPWAASLMQSPQSTIVLFQKCMETGVSDCGT